MASRYLLESGAPDGYLLEDGSGVLILDSPGDATGTAASEFAFSTAGRQAVFDGGVFDPGVFDAEPGAPNVTGSAASSFGWSADGIAEAANPIEGTSDAAFPFSTSGTGGFDFNGAGASEFGWSASGDGVHESYFTGVAATTFGTLITGVFDGGIFDPGTFDSGPGDIASWSTSGSGVVLGAGAGVAASSFGWSTAAAGDSLVITDQSHVSFDWSTAAVGVVSGLEPIRAKNRRLRPLMLPKGVWYQPGSNPEGRLQ